MQIWSPTAGQMIPLSQVTSGAEVVWEDPVVMRRDRFPTITVHADPRFGSAQPAVQPRAAEDRGDRAARRLFARLGRRVRGLRERPAPRLARPLPVVLAMMVFIVVCLFNSDPHHVPDLADHAAGAHWRDGRAYCSRASRSASWLCSGSLALAGELIKNQIVVISKIGNEIEKGKAPYQAILDGCTSKLRPVCMVVLTTVLGMIPAADRPVLRGYGRVHHLRSVVRRYSVLARNAGGVRDVLRHSRRRCYDAASSLTDKSQRWSNS